MKRKKIILHLDRNDVVMLIDALEEVIEMNEEGWVMDEIRLNEFLLDRLHRHDGSHQYRRENKT